MAAATTTDPRLVATRSSFADELLDDVLPGELDWRRLVRRYPMTTLGVAAALGYLLGRRHGRAIVGAATAFASARVTEQLGELLGDEEP